MNIPLESPLVNVFFSSEINTDSTENLLAVMAECANQKVKKVCLFLSTLGGGVSSGLQLYNVLKGMPFELTTHNVGNVDSIGNVVFLAGAKRFACPNATFMFHGVGFSPANLGRMEVKDVQEKLGGLLSDQKRIGAVIADRTGISEDEVTEFFNHTHTLGADDALTTGVIDDIREVEIGLGIPVITLVFKPVPPIVN
ncbi:MAG: ATP-dependent Clp protease proteolytic subunit [Dehalogenimonas sp.]